MVIGHHITEDLVIEGSMLKIRICPKCGCDARSPYTYFCYNCGTDLPGRAEQKESEREERTLRKPLKINIGARLEEFKRFKKSVFIFTLGIISLIFLVIGFNYYLRIKQKQSLSVESGKNNEIVLEQVKFDLPIILFGEGSFSALSPSDIDFYLESSKPDILLTKFLKEGVREKIEGKLGLTLSEAASFLSADFCLIERFNKETNKRELAFIAKAKAYDFVKANLEDINELFSYKSVLLGDNLVVYNSDELYEDIQGAFKKQILSLSLSAEFIETKKKLPVQGQIFIFQPRRPLEPSESRFKPTISLIPEDLSNVGFVINASEKGSLIQMPQ